MSLLQFRNRNDGGRALAIRDARTSPGHRLHQDAISPRAIPPRWKEIKA